MPTQPVPPATPDPADIAATRRAVLGLAVPAFLTLVAEPLFLIADSAIVGHLGTPQLAGLGVASAALLTAAGVFVFLAYGTTALVSRTLGAASEREAIGAGLDGVWLAGALGLVAAWLVGGYAAQICGLFGASAEALDHGTVYLRISALGLPAMLVVLAATGILRGLQDTRTPLIATSVGFGGNIALNVLLVYGMGWGIAGSAWGTVIAQWGLALGLFDVVARAAHRLRAPLRPHLGGILRAALDGVPLLIRTLALRAVLLVTTWVAAGFGDVPLAAYQVSSTIWSFLGFALDALAIAGQALTGRALGAGDVAGTRLATALMARWGLLSGVVAGVALAAVHLWLPALFTDDPSVRTAVAAGLLAVALGQPIVGYAYVLDGVLIGAGDARWLAGAQGALFLAYLPIVAGVAAFSDQLLRFGDGAAVAALWGAFIAFMALRGLLLRHRARGDAWLVTGLTR